MSASRPKPIGPSAAYERLFGRPPSLQQLQRLDLIRTSLGLRDDDAIWSVFICFEYYFGIISDVPTRFKEAGKAQAEALREKFLEDTDLRRVIGEPLTKRMLVASLLVSLALASVAIIGVVCFVLFEQGQFEQRVVAAEGRATERYELERDEFRRQFNNEVEQKVSERLSEYQIVRKLFADPDTKEIASAIDGIGPDSRRKLLDGLPSLIDILQMLASLDPDDRRDLVYALLPGRYEETRSIRRWIDGKLVARDSGLARIIAGYAMGNQRLLACIRELSPRCELDQLELCK